MRGVLLGVSLLLGACATLPPEDLRLTRSILTADTPTDRFARRDRTHYGVDDTIHLISIVQWGDAHTSAGNHQVQWRWYRGGELAVSHEQKTNLFAMPYELYAELPARALGPGEHRVECLIDLRVVDSRDFVVE